MSKAILWKLVIVVGVLALFTWLLYPPEEKIALGLDLQGGSHLVLQVETKAAVKSEVDLAINRIGQGLKEKGITYTSVLSPEGSSDIEVRGTDPVHAADVRDILGTVVPQFTITTSGGDFKVSIPDSIKRQIEATSVDTTLTVLRQRVDELGVKEPIIQRQGAAGDRIVVELPGIQDPDRAKSVLQDQAKLEWTAVAYPPSVGDYESWRPPSTKEATIAMFGGTLPPGVELVPEVYVDPTSGTRTEVWWPLQNVAAVVGNDLRSARRSVDQMQRNIVDFVLSPEAGKRFQAATKENLHKKMAIVLGSSTKKEVISAPVINDVISDRGMIQGRFTLNSAEDLALKLRSGAIPTAVSIIEEHTIGPSLGRDSIHAGVLASILGFVGVGVFMLVYYRLSGVNAVLALLMNVVLVLGAMAYFRATLTLPGIAGLILTVGMAVDSNVLIFERIREELRLGKAVRTAVDQGFSRAFATIIDTHVTTIVSALFLLGYGTGPVKGFAVTLIAGLFCSVFTAVFVSRFIYDLVLGDRRDVESLSI
jgi:preprotein translocase subunit SecD